MSVVDLESWRSSRPETTGSTAATCVCGSEWFALRRRPSDPAHVPDGAMALTWDGQIRGLVGELVCLDCGTALDLARGGV